MHKPEFGVLDYIASYPEVAFLGISPIEHYERFGKRLGYKAPTRITKNVNSLNVSDHENCPLVTVVVPVYDRTWMFRDAINSVLNQDYPNIEIIIVLDGSPQETRAIAKEFANLSNVRIFSFPLPSGNAVRGRNKGIIEARGTFIAFLDSDDIATPQRIRLSVELLQSSGADVVYGAWRAILDGTRPIAGLVDGQIVVSPQVTGDVMAETCVPCQSTVMLRRDLFSKFGFIKETMKYREDHELWARLGFFGCKFVACSEVLTGLRLHEGNNELNFKSSDDYWLRLFQSEYKKIGPHVKKVVFVVQGVGVGGGMKVIKDHAITLRNAGHDVSILNLLEDNFVDEDWWQGFPCPILHLADLDHHFFENVDVAIATFWTTAAFVKDLDVKSKCYLVQSDERLFYSEPEVSEMVRITYLEDFTFIVVAEWLERMLRIEFGKQDVHLVRNGVDLGVFFDRPENRNGVRPRVLIEGPIDNPMKGMLESYEIASTLDCEIWAISTSGQPPAGWRLDKFFMTLPEAEMSHVFSQVDVLVKSSALESFCLPAIEAMASGCAVLISTMQGGVDYLADEINCLRYERGNVADGRAKLNRLLQDTKLRRTLIENGFSTARSYRKEYTAIDFLAVINRT